MLKHRSDLIPIFQTFHKMIQTQFSRTIKVFCQTMPKNTMTNLSSPFWILMAPFPIILVPIPLNKMVVPNANFVTFLMSCIPFSCLPLSLSVFRMKRLSLPFTP